MNHEKNGDIKLSAHPEGFQLDRELNKLYVNVPNANSIEVIDLKSQKINSRWRNEYNSNFPMTIDLKNHIIFVGYRHPGKLTAIDAKNGNTISAIDLVGDIDDLYFDPGTKKIYASGGAGAVNVFIFDTQTIRQIASVPTQSGARTSLLISSTGTFILAERANGGHMAQLKIYSTRN